MRSLSDTENDGMVGLRFSAQSLCGLFIGFVCGSPSYTHKSTVFFHEDGRMFELMSID
jgi:hypothetical protein